MNDAQEDAPMGAVEWTAMLVFYAALIGIFAAFALDSLLPLWGAMALVVGMVAANWVRERLA